LRTGILRELTDLKGWARDGGKQMIIFGTMWPIMLMGLEVLSSHLSPIYPHPSLRDYSTDMLNPWKTWCPNLNAGTTDFTHDYCFGTNIARFGGPYSIMWYWTMFALAGFGRFYPYWNNLDLMFALNLGLVVGIRKRYMGYGVPALMNLLYGWIAILFMIAFPQILLTLFFTGASLLVPREWRHQKMIRAALLILAAAYRFPIGAPWYVWRFIFGFSIHVWGNALPYFLTITFWLVAFGSLIGLSRERFGAFVEWMNRDR
jgi:hypothetical protein